MSGSRHSRLYRKLRPGMPQRGGPRLHEQQSGSTTQDRRVPPRRATNPKTGWHRPEKRPLRQVPPQVFFNPAGLFTHTLALPYGVLEVVLRGCGANFHGDVPEVVWYLAWCSTVSRPRSLLSFPVVAPRTGQSQRVRSAGLMDTAYVVLSRLMVPLTHVSVLTAKGIQGCHLWHETTSVHWGDTVPSEGVHLLAAHTDVAFQSVPSVAVLTERLHVTSNAPNVSCSTCDGDVKAYSVNNTITGFEVKMARSTGTSKAWWRSLARSKPSAILWCF